MMCGRGRDPARVFEWSDFGTFTRTAHRICIYGLHGELIVRIDGLRFRDVQLCSGSGLAGSSRTALATSAFNQILDLFSIRLRSVLQRALSVFTNHPCKF